MSEPMPSKQGTSKETPELRVGVYVCKCGGNISDVIDVEAVAEAAGRIPGVTKARVNTFMCSDPGQQAIEEDIKQEGLNRIIVASCSPFLHEQTFRGVLERAGLNPYLYEHVNIREQGSWSHKGDPAGATAKAVRMIAAAVGKLDLATPLEKIHLPNRQRALIIGGGIAGMKAAVDLAGRGIEVLLVEKGDRLGGRLNDLGPVFISGRPAQEIIDRLQREATDHPKIEILTRAQVKAVKGFIGNFEITVERQGEPGDEAGSTQHTAGVLIVATGFEPYVPGEGEFGYRQAPEVLTMPEFVALMEQTTPGARELEVQGRPVRSIAFIHCVGSRQLDGVHEPQPDGNVNAYCSRICCTTVLWQACRVKERFPQTEVYDLHQDIRAYGRGHEDLYYQASRAGVLFFRYHGEEAPVVVSRDRGGPQGPPLEIRVKDYLTWGEELSIHTDLVVLAVGMMPGRIDGLTDMLKLPVGGDRFLQEIHPKLRPVEIAVNGILLAGTAQGPMNIAESLTAASAAAVKASAMLSTDQVELNPYVARVREDLCDGTGLCVRECEYSGALDLVEEEVDGKTVRRAKVNPGLCVGCGSCVAVCPNRAIDLQGWTLSQYEAMVDAIAGAPATAPAENAAG